MTQKTPRRTPSANAATIGHINHSLTGYFEPTVTILLPEHLKTYQQEDTQGSIRLSICSYQTITSTLESLAKYKPDLMIEFLRACQARQTLDLPNGSAPYPLSQAFKNEMSKTPILFTKLKDDNSYFIPSQIKLIALASYQYKISINPNGRPCLRIKHNKNKLDTIITNSYKIIMNTYGRPCLHLPSLKLDVTVTDEIMYNKSSSLMPNQSILSQLQALSLSSNTRTETSTHVSVNKLDTIITNQAYKFTSPTRQQAPHESITPHTSQTPSSLITNPNTPPQEPINSPIPQVNTNPSPLGMFSATAEETIRTRLEKLLS